MAACWTRLLLQPLRAKTCHQRSSRLCLHLSSKLYQSGGEAEEMEHLQKNPHYAKYADKIAKLQKTKPDEFNKRLEKVEEINKPVPVTGDSKEREFSMPTKPKSGLSSQTSMKKEKTLEDVMKIDLIADKSAEEISTLWKAFFTAKKEKLCAVIPSATFRKMKELYGLHKTFLLPLPRRDGYEFFIVQFLDNEAHFTSLINYQAYKENAPEVMTLVHYTDVAESKEIVLMVGEFDGNSLSLQEAQCLANQVEMYYCNPSESKKYLLDTFTFKPQEFKHQDLVDQLENISLLTEEPSSSKAAKK